MSLILFVDDDAATANAVCRIFRAKGYACDSAPTLATAKRLLLTNAYDVVVTDLGLPDGSGTELAPLCAPRRIPAIALSGFGMEGDLRAGADAGFVHYLVKPVSAAALLAAVASALEASPPLTVGPPPQ